MHCQLSLISSDMSHHDDKKKFFHYTSKPAAEAIVQSGKILPSDPTQGDAVFGPGPYAASMTPSSKAAWCDVTPVAIDFFMRHLQILSFYVLNSSGIKSHDFGGEIVSDFSTQKSVIHVHERILEHRPGAPPASSSRGPPGSRSSRHCLLARP